MKAITDIPITERPREKLKTKGAAALSDHELLAALLGRGTKSIGVNKLAVWILKLIDEKNGTLSFDDLNAIPGMGDAKSCQVLSALEFSRRRIKPSETKISFPQDVLKLVSHLADRKQEHLVCISLNGANEVINTRIVTIGLIDRTSIHPREVFSDVITDRASSIILAHNHPSGDLYPSDEDLKVTKAISEAGKLLGIELLDHIIFSCKGFYSFKESNKL